ncbi:MAG TPA: NAD-dependent deacetylase [Candidatus Mediterraneibacter faecigallinarum]|uniref:protein acetyllysine N-acetyltransferase n=1 Tax=Candidatus Mediterraneibacter faecigallinarum TaxID=2838669 RepID=A0A9D2NXJ2_9FIRM|nr:NAD-dependent deacetylase [Candidatus Mediterraneibacter faecigallinarum]
MKEKNILQVLRESRYTVVLSGVELMKESGYPLLRDGDESYEIEEKYGYSFEEIFSSSFYSARKERFFRFYKEVILKAAEIPPGQGFYDLKQLQDYGLIHSIITRRIAGLEDRAGCRNVINLKGTIFHNTCPNCGREYPMEYIRDAKGVPLCEQCLVAIRPDVCLFGEMIDNGLMTRAAKEIEKADVVLVLGSSLHSPLCSQMLQYYSGTNLILVTESEHYSDQQADIIVYGRSDDFLRRLNEEYRK